MPLRAASGVPGLRLRLGAGGKAGALRLRAARDPRQLQIAIVRGRKEGADDPRSAHLAAGLFQVPVLCSQGRRSGPVTDRGSTAVIEHPVDRLSGFFHTLSAILSYFASLRYAAMPRPGVPKARSGRFSYQ